MKNKKKPEEQTLTKLEAEVEKTNPDFVKWLRKKSGKRSEKK